MRTHVKEGGDHPKNHGKPWSEDGIKYLKHCVDMDTSISLTAQELGRTVVSVLCKAHSCGYIDLDQVEKGWDKTQSNTERLSKYGQYPWSRIIYNDNPRDLRITIGGKTFTGFAEGEEIKEKICYTKIPKKDYLDFLDGHWDVEDNISIPHRGYTEFSVDSSLQGINEMVNCTNCESINNKGEWKMTNQRRKVIVELFDDSKGIEAEDSLVYATEVVTDLDDQQVIHEALLQGEVQNCINGHNELRFETVDQDILERTGNEVNLKAVKLKDLRWVVR